MTTPTADPLRDRAAQTIQTSLKIAATLRDLDGEFLNLLPFCDRSTLTDRERQTLVIGVRHLIGLARIQLAECIVGFAGVAQVNLDWLREELKTHSPTVFDDELREQPQSEPKSDERTFERN